MDIREAREFSQINCDCVAHCKVSKGEGYLAALNGPEVKALVEACEKIKTQFKCISMHQHRLLIRGQDLESASKNWDEATEGQFIDFEELFESLATFHKQTAKTGGKS